MTVVIENRRPPRDCVVTCAAVTIIPVRSELSGVSVGVAFVAVRRGREELRLKWFDYGFALLVAVATLGQHVSAIDVEAGLGMIKIAARFPRLGAVTSLAASCFLIRIQLGHYDGEATGMGIAVATGTGLVGKPEL